MLNLQRFGAGQPMYRTDKWQNYFGVPLAAATQWQLLAAATKPPQWFMRPCARRGDCCPAAQLA
jgi:hypothetical protein